MSAAKILKADRTKLPTKPMDKDRVWTGWQAGPCPVQAQVPYWIENGPDVAWAEVNTAKGLVYWLIVAQETSPSLYRRAWAGAVTWDTFGGLTDGCVFQFRGGTEFAARQLTERALKVLL